MKAPDDIRSPEAVFLQAAVRVQLVLVFGLTKKSLKRPEDPYGSLEVREIRDFPRRTHIKIVPVHKGLVRVRAGGNLDADGIVIPLEGRNRKEFFYCSQAREAFVYRSGCKTS